MIRLGKVTGKCVLCGDEVILEMGGDEIQGGIILKFPDKLMCLSCYRR